MAAVSHPQQWLVTADARRATLFSCQRLPGGGLHLEPQRTIENVHEAEHERHRPMLAGGAERRGSIARSGARAAPHTVATGRTAEEEDQRFAREVGGWLSTARRELALGTMTVFAAPRFLGLLREQPGFDGAEEMHAAELSQLPAQELALHPAVLRAVTGR